MPAADLQLRACQDEPFIILGQRLHPLRLGHVEMLYRWNLAGLATPSELLAAIHICSHWPRQVERMSRRWSLSVFLWLLRLRMRGWDFRTKRALFLEFLDYHLQRPEVHCRGEILESAVPFHQQLRAILCSRLGYDPLTVGDVPMQRALWDYYAWAELEGRLSVLPQTADDIEAALAALEAPNVAALLARLAAQRTNSDPLAPAFAEDSYGAASPPGRAEASPSEDG